MNRTSKPRLAVVKARWHSEIVDEAHRSFVAEVASLTEDNAELDVYEVPGAFEIPLLAKNLASTGEYSAIVACGFVVDGGIYRHEFVASAVAHGLMTAQLDTGVPILSVVLTPKTFIDTPDQRNYFREHFSLKGREAASACVDLLKQRRRLATT